MAIKVVVCGDSFMATGQLGSIGRHFSELLSPEFDIVNLARPGVSNTDICYQLKEACAIRPDWVVVGTTDTARIEMPKTGARVKIPDELTIKNFRNGPDQLYVSATINTFIAEEPDLKHNVHKLSDQQRLAVKMYLSYMYSDRIQRDQKDWMIGYWLTQFEKNNIKHKVLPKDFCIYQYAKKFPYEKWSFHTDFATQQVAANLLREELLK
jgi:hypothetical protein